MKKHFLFAAIALLVAEFGTSQTNTIVNYDFNDAKGYPVYTGAEESISCMLTASESFQLLEGAMTTASAFVQNSAGNALAMVNKSSNNKGSFVFNLSGAELKLYRNFRLYMQIQSNPTGYKTISLAYSTDGSGYTELGGGYDIPSAYGDLMVDLSSIQAINNADQFYLKLTVNGATATSGLMRIDNFQVQASKGTTDGGSTPWQVNGKNVTFTGMLGIGVNPSYSLEVKGDAKIGDNLRVSGSSILNGDVQATSLSFGETANKISFTTAMMANGARIGVLGNLGPVQPPPTTCMKPFITGDLQQSHRFTITQASSSNMLDLTNDGSNGYIDYGFDINMFHPIDPNTPDPPRPALKLNSFCWGDVEIAKGGGYASTGPYFEVGNPVRTGNIASNINAPSRIGQRVTVSSVYPETVPNPPAAYNSQFFVNRNRIRALAVFNTTSNTAGEETFSVFGNGKTQINAVTKADKYFVVNDITTSSSPNESFVVYGSGKTEIRVNAPGATPDAFDVYDVQNSKVQFRVKSTGYVYAREVEIQTGVFPDYVFADSYKRLSLPQLESYIHANKHLPNFESADYYITNGIRSSEMFVKQQETIESLTLYIIELEKRLKALEEAARH